MIGDNVTETYMVTWKEETRTSESFTCLDWALNLYYSKLEEGKNPRIWLENKGFEIMPAPIEYWRSQHD
jgi:hypothetical protein